MNFYESQIVTTILTELILNKLGYFVWKWERGLIKRKKLSFLHVNTHWLIFFKQKHILVTFWLQIA